MCIRDSHSVRPGITGLAQSSGRNRLSWDDKLELDAKYVETACMRLDIQILLTTAATVVQRDGIAAEGQVTMTHFEGTGSVQ